MLKLIIIFVMLGIMYPQVMQAEELPADPPVITIKAGRFYFSPQQIKLKRGMPVALEIEATDRLHGFSVPELGLRVDADVGRKGRLTFTPEKSGRFIFMCDVFCGSGHEEMAGEMVVE